MSRAVAGTAGYDRQVTAQRTEHDVAAPEPRLTKGQRTRQRIFDAAFDLFGRHGFQGVSLRDIAARVGVTHVTVLHYFPSKDALLAALMMQRDEVERQAAALFLASDHEPDPEYRGLRSPGLRWFMHRLQVNADDHGAAPLFLRVSTEASDPAHPAHAHFVARYEFVVGRLADAFAEELAHRPAGSVDVDPRTAAQHLVALSDGLPMQSMYGAHERLTLDDAWEYLRMLGVASAA